VVEEEFQKQMKHIITVKAEGARPGEIVCELSRFRNLYQVRFESWHNSGIDHIWPHCMKFYVLADNAFQSALFEVRGGKRVNRFAVSSVYQYSGGLGRVRLKSHTDAKVIFYELCSSLLKAAEVAFGSSSVISARAK